jgi:hypothetical protein
MPVATVGAAAASSSPLVPPAAGTSGAAGLDAQKVEDDAPSRQPRATSAAACSNAAQAALTELKLGG